MSADAAPLCLRAEDAIKLGEVLEFLITWLGGTSDLFTDALADFCGAGYTVEDLRADLARFSLLLGGDDQFVFGDER
jgi:hypothetical protein